MLRADLELELRSASRPARLHILPPADLGILELILFKNSNGFYDTAHGDSTDEGVWYTYPGRKSNFPALKLRPRYKFLGPIAMLDTHPMCASWRSKKRYGRTFLLPRPRGGFTRGHSRTGGSFPPCRLVHFVGCYQPLRLIDHQLLALQLLGLCLFYLQCSRFSFGKSLCFEMGKKRLPILEQHKALLIGELSYKIDARFMRDELCSRRVRIGNHADGIHVYEEDAHQLLMRCHQFLPTKSLVYLDPPYYVKGAGLYRNFYKHDDHVRIAKLLGSDRFRRPWVVSYDNAEEIKEMYAYSEPFAYGLKYTAQRRYTGSEVMFFSKRIQAPFQAMEQIAA